MNSFHLPKVNLPLKASHYTKSGFFFSLLMAFILSSSSLHAQFSGCNSGDAHPAAGQPYNIPSAGNSLLTSPAYGGQYFRVNVQAGKTYSFTTCEDETGAPREFDTQLTITNTSNSIFAADDDGGCQTAAKLEWTASFSGEIRLYVHAYIAGDCKTTTVQDLTWVRMQEVAQQQQPDLVGEITSGPSSASPGATITFSTKITNNGNANAGSSKARYYLSTDQNFSGNDVFLNEPGANGTPGVDDIPAINAGQNHDETEPIIIPSNTSPGNYYILYVVDYEDDVDESNEGNNVSTKFISIQAGAKPDYTVSNLSTNNGTVGAGSSFSMNLTIANIGSANGNGNGGKDRFYLSTNSSLDGGDVEIGEGNTGSLNAGASFDVGGNVTIPGNTSPGFYYILFSIDDDNQVDESNEGNNVDSYSIEVINGNPKPEYNTSFFRGPSSVNAGSSFTLTFDMYNDGDASGNGNGGNDKIYLSTDQSLGNADVFLKNTPTQSLSAGELAADETTSINIPSGTSTGNYYIIYFIDADDKIDESDEGNNLSYYPIFIQNNGGGGLPDLIGQFTGGPSSANPGQTITFNTKVTNQGNAPYNNTSESVYFLSPTPAYDGNEISLNGPDGTGGFDVHPSLNAGQSVDETEAVTIPANTTPGNYYILYLVDYYDDATESNENNNLATKQITIGGGGGNQPDYTAQFTGGPTSATPGQSVSFNLNIQNIGNASGNGNGGQDKFYLSTDANLSGNDIQLGSGSTANMSAGQSFSVFSPNLTIPGNTNSGSYYILFFIDADDKISESNEGNNVASYFINIQGGGGGGNKPDYTAQITGGPTSIQAGQSGTYTPVITNQGNANGQNCEARYYLSTDASFSNDDIFLNEPGVNGTPGIDYLPAISVGQNVNESEPVIIPANTGTGNYYILYVVDVDNDVDESNEGNNVASYPISVQGNGTAPTANFTASTTNPCWENGQTNTVSFTNQSSENPTLYSWSFNPGSVAYQNGTNSSSANPQVKFLALGTYTVSLTATNNFGSDSEVKTSYITATNCGPANWNVEETGDNHSVIIEATAVLLIEGSPIQVGDYIGAFYMDNGVEKCAGKAAWTGSNTSVTVYGDDNSTGQKDGFSTNEVFNWRMWRAATNQEYPASATYKPISSVITHTNRFAPDGISAIATMTGSSSQTHNLTLQPGWNLISTYVMAANMNMSSIFSGIQSSIALAKNGSGDVFVPSPPINTIGNWDITQGYKVKVISSTPVNLQIVGQKVNPASNPISLKAGWNQIAYLRDSDQPIQTAFAPIQSQIIIAKDGRGNVYSPQFNLNNIGNLRPGQGYQVKMSSLGSLTYNARLAGPVSNGMHTAQFSAKNFKNVVPTEQNATVILHANQQLNIGDEVGVFTPSGKLVGSGVYEGHTLGFPIWGDDPSTNIIDGLQAGESFEIKIWNQQTQRQTLATFTIEQGQNAYKSNDIFEISLQKTTALEGGALIANSLVVYPNPAKNASKLKLNLVEAAQIQVQVFTIAGKAVLPVTAQRLAGGLHELKINTSDLAEGMYYIRVAVNGIPQNLPLSIIK